MRYRSRGTRRSELKMQKGDGSGTTSILNQELCYRGNLICYPAFSQHFSSNSSQLHRRTACTSKHRLLCSFFTLSVRAQSHVSVSERTYLSAGISRLSVAFGVLSSEYAAHRNTHIEHMVIYLLQLGSVPLLCADAALRQLLSVRIPRAVDIDLCI